jgi:tRNA1Val (adenine37-N6)-methyltransferase
MQSSHSEDSILRKEIKILQPLKGYRFAIDSVLLARFIKTKEDELILEVGAGSGVVTILLSAIQKFHSGIAVEIQPDLAALCRTNFERNKITNVAVDENSIQDLAPQLNPHSFDLIYSNPPYRKAGSGKLNLSRQKSIARHEMKLELEDLFRCSEMLLKKTGRLSLILPLYRENDLTRLARKYQMRMTERQYVHSFENQPAAFLLSTLSRTDSPLREHPRIVIYEKPGEYTEQMKKLL